MRLGCGCSFPAEKRAEIEEILADAARPYPRLDVQTVQEPTNCGNCGAEITGRGAKVKDERCTYCGPCLRSAADAVSA